ncbi:MAG: NAD(P)/FAD-dependent oxidoreductase [Oscillospiraceae bacterium]|nr:NAD(P)/FAD-dependent oxidoreductase [Oscillospiraceae bacterium]
MKKAIIIGAGPAGLTAAYELLSKNEGYSVTILEQSAAIGGISQTVSYNGNRMDIGGHRFFSKSEEVRKIWRELMPLQSAPSYDDKVLGRKSVLEKGNDADPEVSDEVMLVRERVSRIYYGGHFFDYPISLKPDTIKNMGLITTMRAGLSYLYACLFKKPETNLENFYINRFGKVLYSMFFEGYTQKLWGRHPREISADWGAQRVKGLSITALIKDIFSKLFRKGKSRKVETSLIEQFWYPKYGPGQLWELMARRIEELGGRILFGHSVKAIHCDGRHIGYVECETESGNVKFEGDIFFSSMPVNELVSSMGDTPCNVVRKIAKGLPYRDFVTVGLLVDSLNLKNETGRKTLSDIVPDCWIYVQDTGVKLGRIQIFNNWSPYMVKKPEDTVWLGLEYFCDEGDEFWSMDEKECTDFAVSELVRMGIIEKGAVLDSHRERVKKAYPAYFDTYKYFDRVIKFLDSFDNLYCIGRNGQHRYNNMDHSMLTAIEAVGCAVSGKRDRQDIWNVNTEKEYHEQK